jgi:MYND finger
VFADLFFTVLCGRWEAYPREFAKCRRCRKAKYCGKECQSTAWSEGHRFWCSAKDGDDDATGEQHQHHQPPASAQTQTPEDRDEINITPDDSMDAVVPVEMTPGTTVVGRPERRRERAQAVVSNTGDLSQARGGGAPHRGAVAHGNSRGEGSSTRIAHQQLRQQQHQQLQAPVVPSPARMRPQVPGSPANNGNGNGNYLTFDMHPELGSGRRRAETVTGATSVVGEASLRAHHHPHFHVHSRIHSPNTMRFVPAQHSRPADSGQVPSTRRRRGDNGTVGAGGFRLPVEDHDMVLG